MSRSIEIVLGKLQAWGQGFVEILPNLAVALLVLSIAGLFAALGRRLVGRTAERLKVRPAVRRLLATTLWMIIVAIGGFVALGVLKLDKTVTSLLAGAGVIGLAVGFAAQNLVSSLLSGVLISVRRPFREGDLIEAAGHFGTVERVDLRITRIRTPQGQTLLVPNKQLLDQPLVNYSALERRRVDLEVGISYDDDLALAKRVALEAVADLENSDLGPAELFFTEFGSSSIHFVLRFWVAFKKQADYLYARSEAVMRIKRAFDEHGISIPFPIRTLDLDAGARSLLSAAIEGAARGEKAA